MDDLDKVAIERLSTGSTTLNDILGGGLPAYSLNVIAGGPGTGKSVLTLETLFHQARQGKKSIYFTTLSEPALKFIHYMQQFSFFDPRLVDEMVFFHDLGGPARSEGIEGALDSCVEQLDLRSPDLVAIDSFRAFHDLVREPDRIRTFAYDLAVSLAASRATAFLVGEYYQEEVGRYPEFTVADGIIHLLLATQSYRATRELEVLKLRGSDYKSGRHFFEITANGLVVYPRVAVPKEVEDGYVELSPQARLDIGVRGLDEMLGGGLPANSSTVIQGGTGTGKTILALSFLMEGALQGESGLLFTMEETREQIYRMALARGWDLNALEKRRLIRVIYTSPVELAGDTLLQKVNEAIAQTGAKRVVLDSLSALGLSMASEGRFRELVYTMVKVFRSLGVTAVLTNEIPELLGHVTLTGHGVSSIADNIILLRYVELESNLRRALSVLKMRGTEHTRELREFEITRDQVRVIGPFKSYHGVLTGVPMPADPGARRDEPVEQKRGE